MLSLVEQLREFETPLIAEAMGAMGISGKDQLYTGSDVRLLTTMSEPMVGTALVLTVDSSTPGRTPDAADLWKTYTHIQESELPTVVVMKCVGADLKRECVLGDGMAKIFKAHGACGLVTDGGCRDVQQINKVGFTVYGSGTVTDHATLVYKLSEEPVTISGVTISTGDLVHADHDGVMIVPEVCHGNIVEACALSRDFETRAHLVFRRTDVSLQEKQAAVGNLVVAHQERCRALLAVTQSGEMSHKQ